MRKRECAYARPLQAHSDWFIVVLVGFSTVVALHTVREPRSADDQAQQRRATQVDRPVTADVVQRASPQIVGLGLVSRRTRPIP